MRHLCTGDIAAALVRGNSVESSCGRSPLVSPYVRYIELRPAFGNFEVWLFDIEDLGSEEQLDLYEFPRADPESESLVVCESVEEALAFASSQCAASSVHWVKSGVIQSEYHDFIRAGRPSAWPLAA